MFRPSLIAAVSTLLAAPVLAQASDSTVQTFNGSTQMREGRTISGELTSQDPTLSDGTHYDCYSVLTAPGRRIQIDQTSSAFDSYLLVGERSCTELTNPVQNDDGGGGLNARVILEGDGGIYYILANSVGAGATGRYQLSVSSAALAPAVTRVTVGQTISGALTASDPTLSDNSHYDCFAVQTRAGQRLQIDQTSSEFDSFLSVGGGSCDNLTAVETDDDSGGGLNARVIRQGDGSVLYIKANSLSAGETGAYQLRVSAVGAGGASGGASGAPASSPYGNVDARSLGAARPTSLPSVTSEWDTDGLTCYAAYGAMVAMVAESVAPTEWGNVGQIDYAARQNRLRSRINLNDPYAEMIDFNTTNFKSMAMVGAIGLAPNGQPNQGRPLAEYLTTLANCDRAHNMTPVTRY